MNDSYIAGIESLFNKINCERTAIDDMLGAQTGVTEQNMIQYLGIIEERCNMLLLIQSYSNKQKVSMNPSSYLRSSNFWSEAVVDGDFKSLIFIQCSCLIAPLRGYMNRHCEDSGCSLKTLEGRSLIGNYTASFDMVAYLRSHNMINHGLRALVQGLWV